MRALHESVADPLPPLLTQKIMHSMARFVLKLAPNHDTTLDIHNCAKHIEMPALYFETDCGTLNQPIAFEFVRMALIQPPQSLKFKW